MAWLMVAQDATKDDGVAQAYLVDTKQWTASYPETTGYIIPTFFDYAALTKGSQFRLRAIRMARWEQVIQLPEGGVQASTIDAEQIVPVVFNTGMVIFGWVRAYQETGEKSFLYSAEKAASWLRTIQEPDGAWRTYGSPLTAYDLNTYNTRTAWALLELDRIAPDENFCDVAQRNLDWALTQQENNGWLNNNCFFDSAQPYTHTIGYAMRGFLESGALLGDRRYLDAAEAIFRGIEPAIRRSGFLAGRFDRNWKGTVSYCCLAGSAQLALNGLRLYEMTGKASYRTSAQRLLRYLIRTQDLASQDRNIAGAIAGSWPVQGDYHSGQYPNWAAKFAADAIMLELKLQQGL